MNIERPRLQPPSPLRPKPTAALPRRDSPKLAHQAPPALAPARGDTSRTALPGDDDLADLVSELEALLSALNGDGESALPLSSESSPLLEPPLSSEDSPLLDPPLSSDDSPLLEHPFPATTRRCSNRPRPPWPRRHRPPSSRATR